METQLLYMTSGQTESDSAKVENVFNGADGRTVLILDKTIFYPQGGGQQYDQGVIQNENGVFNVQEVRFTEGLVHHIGSFLKGKISAGETVKSNVDAQRRKLNSKLQSAGHLIDVALRNIGYKQLTPLKGFHFPEGPYVEYSGEVTGEDLVPKLQVEINRLTATGYDVITKLSSLEEAKRVCYYFPPYIPEGKPIRIVAVWNNEFIPCGGTHVENIKELQGLQIKNIKARKGNTRVSYLIN